MSKIQDDKMIEVTEGHFANFLISLGTVDHEVCPRCSANAWNIDRKDLSRVFLSFPLSHIQNKKTFLGVFSVACDACGFTEEFLARPLAEHVVAING